MVPNENELPEQSELEAAVGNQSEIDETDDLATFSDEERPIALKLRATMLPRLAELANRQAEANKARELKDMFAKIVEDNEKILKEKIEEYRKALTPPTPDELNKILSQEYIEFKLEIRAAGQTREFVIRELPLDAETKILKAIQKTLSERMVEFGRVEWQANMNMADRIQKIISIVPGAAETLADCVAVCLDPFGEDETINGKWVTRNIGLQKFTAIIHAQVEVSRYRDFFSLASRFIPGMMNL